MYRPTFLSLLLSSTSRLLVKVIEKKTHIVCTLRKGNYPVTTKIDRPCPIWKLTTDSQVKLIFQPSVSRTNNLSHNLNAKRGGKKLRYKTSPLFFLVNKMIER